VFTEVERANFAGVSASAEVRLKRRREEKKRASMAADKRRGNCLFSSKLVIRAISGFSAL
jgi:hypothetical protein